MIGTTLLLATMAADPAAVALLERAQARNPLAETTVIKAVGELDLAARNQGTHPGHPDWVSAEEVLVVEGGTVTYETHAKVNPDADEHLRYIYDAEGRMLIVDLLNRSAFRVPSGGDDAANRYRRADPAFLIADALAHRDTLESRGDDMVAYTLDSGVTVTLGFGADARLRSAAYPLSIPVHGDTTVKWRFDADGYQIRLGDRTFKRMRYVSGGLDPHPADIAIPEPPPAEPASAPEPPAGPPPLPEPREIAEGVYLVPNIRSGFHVLLVEFEDHFVAIDAPAGYFELQMIPPVNWGGDVETGDIGRRYLAVARAIDADKPVRYVALTHWHGDHLGDVGAFVEAGATVIGTATTRAVVKRIAPGAPFIEVDGRHTLTDGSMTLELIDVGENPHAEGMLVAWLPEQRILYNSDLFEPIPMRVFPNAARVPVMRWFVDWLDRSGLDPGRIYAVHGSARVTEEALDRIRADE